jgi:hypothetical protein
MSKLLINEPPLQLLPSLAMYVGLNEAIILQQLHYWALNPKMGKMDGERKWIRNSAREWRESNFPFWSEKTIAKILKRLERKKFIDSRNDFNTHGYDRTKWYSLNYKNLYDFLPIAEEIPTVSAQEAFHNMQLSLNCERPQLQVSTIESLKTMPYSEFLTTEYWDIIRKFMLDQARFKCQLCNSNGTLHVHHKTYDHHGNEHNHLEDLIVLCEGCHRKFHNKEKIT